MKANSILDYATKIITSGGTVFSILASFGTTPSPALANFLDLSVGTKVDFISHDRDRLTLDNRMGSGNLFYPIWVGPEKGGMVSNIVVPPGAFVEKLSTKQKSGQWQLEAVVGDPIGIFEGSITSGSGIFEITTEGIPELFSSSVIKISFVEGFGTIGVTLPGNQLEGLDGNDTFIEYTTSWCSFEPIGEIIDNDGITQPISLGCFQLNSSGRPSEFFYDFDPSTATASGTFTIQEDFVSGGITLPGTVTKNLSLQISVPEPTSALSLFAFGILGVASTLNRKLKPSKSSEKETTKVG